MNQIYFGISILIYSILGFYLIKPFNKCRNIYYGVIEPFYGVFGILSIFCKDYRLPTIFILGILGACILNLIFSLIDKRLKVDVPIIWFGLFNILNTFIINRLVEFLLNSSPYQSITYLFIFGLSCLTIDVALSLRKLL